MSISLEIKGWNGTQSNRMATFQVIIITDGDITWVYHHLYIYLRENISIFLIKTLDEKNANWNKKINWFSYPILHLRRRKTNNNNLVFTAPFGSLLFASVKWFTFSCKTFPNVSAVWIGIYICDYLQVPLSVRGSRFLIWQPYNYGRSCILMIQCLHKQLALEKSKEPTL